MNDICETRADRERCRYLAHIEGLFMLARMISLQCVQITMAVVTSRQLIKVRKEITLVSYFGAASYLFTLTYKSEIYASMSQKQYRLTKVIPKQDAWV